MQQFDNNFTTHKIETKIKRIVAVKPVLTYTVVLAAWKNKQVHVISTRQLKLTLHQVSITQYIHAMNKWNCINGAMCICYHRYLMQLSNWCIVWLCNGVRWEYGIMHMWCHRITCKWCYWYVVQLYHIYGCGME